MINNSFEETIGNILIGTIIATGIWFFVIMFLEVNYRENVESFKDCIETTNNFEWCEKKFLKY